MTTTVRSAGLRKLFSDTFLVSDGEEISVIVTLPLGASIPSDTLSIIMVFKDRDATSTNITWATNDKVVYFTCTGWKNPSGVALLSPQEFGRNGDGPLFVNLAHYNIGQRNLVHLEILQRTAPVGLMGQVS
jgi:hypothetical protein